MNDRILGPDAKPVEPRTKTAAELMGWSSDLSDVALSGSTPTGSNGRGTFFAGHWTRSREWIDPMAGRQDPGR